MPGFLGLLPTKGRLQRVLEQYGSLLWKSAKRDLILFASNSGKRACKPIYSSEMGKRGPVWHFSRLVGRTGSGVDLMDGCRQRTEAGFKMKASTKADLRTIRRVIAIFRPYRWQAILLLVLIMVISLLGLANTFLIRAIFDDAIAGKNYHHLLIYAGLIFVLPVLGNFIGLGQSLLNMRIGQSVVRDLRVRLYVHLQHMSLRFYTGTKAGEIQSRLTNDIGGVQGLVMNTAPNGVSNLLAVISVVVSMLYISPVLTFLAVCLLPLFIFFSYQSGKLRRTMNKRRQETLARLSTHVDETLSMSGILLLKIFGRQGEAREHFERQSGTLVDLEVQQQLALRKVWLIFGVIFSAIPAGIYLIGGWQMISGGQLCGASMTAGSLIAFTALQSRLLGPATQLLLLQADVQAGLALFDRIFEYLDMPIDIIDGPSARRLEPAQVRGEVAFANVCFTYPRKPHDGAVTAAGWEAAPAFPPTLKGISFSIAPGKVTALVGPSGAGKTTIAHLVPRLYDVDSGAVTIDGHDVRDISLPFLAGIVGVVTQETYLLHASVRDNLLYAKPDATESEMIAAAKIAAIHDCITKLDKGYDTVVGEHGYKLSGGEKQRLAIARIVLKNPPIVILDEATSALDSNSERLVQEALDRLIRGRTTLVIAHRLSTILGADEILVVERGEIVDRGPHAALLARGGLYAQLYHQQFGIHPEPRA